MSRLPSAGSPQPLMKSDGLPCHRRLGRPLVPGERLPVVDTAYGRPLPAEAGILEPKTAPRPHPSRGAGGPLRRAAGWVSCEPLVLLVEQDEPWGPIIVRPAPRSAASVEAGPPAADDEEGA